MKTIIAVLSVGVILMVGFVVGTKFGNLQRQGAPDVDASSVDSAPDPRAGLELDTGQGRVNIVELEPRELATEGGEAGAKEEITPSPYPALVGSAEQPVQAWQWRTIGEFPWPKQPDTLFDAKYPETLTQEELHDLGLKKLEEFGQLTQAPMDKQLAEGEYEWLEMPLPIVETGPEKGAIRIKPSLYMQTKIEAPPGFRGLPYFRHYLDVKNGRVGIAWFKFRDYPELYTLMDEYQYLFDRYGKMKANK
jgi:hypothetical protein